MKRILLIDDLRSFKSAPVDSEVVIARNSQEALEVLGSNESWDEIWLDHDLGEVNGVNDTIMPVIDYFSEQAFFGSPVDVKIIYIHTSNPVGRKQMKTSLNRYGYSPVVSVEAARYFVVSY